jgi:hypothetical protein
MLLVGGIVFWAGDSFGMGTMQSSDSVVVHELPVKCQQKLMEYEEKNVMHKAAVVAVDPGGHYALGLAYGCSSAREAEIKALEQCMLMKEKHGVLSDPYPCMLDNMMVYENMVKNELVAGDFTKREMYENMKKDMMAGAMEMK